MKSVHLVNAIIGLIIGGVAGGFGTYLWMQQPKPLPVGRQASGCCPAMTEFVSRAHESETDGHADEVAADAHDDTNVEGEERCVELSPEAIKEAGIEVADAIGGEIEETLTLPAEITLNADRAAHIVPRVAGIVHRVDKFVGDNIQAGEVMAVLESRELAEAKAAYLAAQHRLSLAQASFKSAQQLHDQKLMPDLKFFATRNELAAAELEIRTAENKLHTLGVLHSECAKLPEETDALAMYELRAPFAGTVVDKHCSLGEVISDRTDCFILADLSNVWANVTIYPQDLARVAVGQKVHLRAGDLTSEGEIAYISAALSETTRTAVARVVVANPDRRWRPGLFATAAIVLARQQVPVLVANDAIQTIENQPAVFIHQNGEFVLRHIAVGRNNATHSEIRAGLKAGDRYVAKGAFLLKAELAKGSGGHEH